MNHQINTFNQLVDLMACGFTLADFVLENPVVLTEFVKNINRDIGGNPASEEDIKYYLESRRAKFASLGDKGMKTVFILRSPNN